MTTLISLDKDVSKIPPLIKSNETKKNKSELRKENLIYWKWSHEEKPNKSERYKQYNTYVVPNFNSIEEGNKFPRENKRTINSSRMGKRERMGVSSYEDEKLINYMKTKYLCHYAISLNDMCNGYKMVTFNEMIEMVRGQMLQNYIRMQDDSQNFQIVFTNNIYRSTLK